MLTYQYTARDPKSGEKVKSEVQAEDEKSAAKLVRQNGLAILDIKLKSESNSLSNGLFKKIKTKDKVVFSRQLSTLINAGLPLVQSLRNVTAQTKKKSFRDILSKIITDVEAGKTFSEALAKYPLVFDAVFVNLVAAGETSGTLDVSLERLANQQEKDAEIISKVRGAMIYPLIVLAVMVGVVIFMIVSVLPAVQSVYNGIAGAQLPLITRILLGISNFTRKYWWLELIIIIIVVFATSRWARTLGGKRYIDKMKMRTWPISKLFMKLYMARFTRVGATLVASGVPLIQMLQVTGKAIDNVHIEESLMKATEKIKGGKSLSEAIRGDPSFLPLVPDMLQIGEQAGALEEMLSKTADYYEREVDDEIRAISTTIEPALMIVMGICAIVIVIAILLPVYSLVGNDIIKI